MTGPSTAPCQPWAEWSDVAVRHCDVSELGGEVNQDRVLILATELLARLAINHGAPRYGVCSATDRPCRRCMCHEHDWCSCPGYYFVTLQAKPVVSITKVIVLGVELDSSAYWVDDWEKLFRADGTPWPYYQDRSLLTPDATFSVEYTYGLVPPPSAVDACAELAYQFALSDCGDNKCQLPQRVRAVFREGVQITMLDPMQFMDNGLTGIYGVDLFLKSFDTKTAGGGMFHPGLIHQNVRSHT